MSKFDKLLGSMSVSDLAELGEAVQDAVEVAKAREKQALIDRFDIMAKDVGMSLKDVIGDGLRRKCKPQSRHNVPLIRNPANPAQTWSGRGRRPHWFSPETMTRA